MTTMETGVASGVSFALTDEQRELRALAREFAEKEIRPKAAEYDEHQTHPADVVAKAHEVGLMNLHLPESLGGPGALRVRRDARRRGAELGLLGDRHVDPRKRPRRRARSSSPARTSRSATGCAPLVEEPILGCFGLSEPGAGSDVSRDPDHGCPERRRVRRQRVEDVHHERRPRVVDRSASPRPTRSKGHRGPLRVRDPDGRRGRHDREAPRQDGAARDRHVRGRVPGRRRAGGEPARRRRATGSRSRCRRSTSRARAPPSAPSASRRPRTSSRSSTRRSASSSAMPIAMNQGVSFLVADMATEIEASRLLTWQAAWMHRPGLRAQGDEVLVVREAVRRGHRDEGDHRRGPGLRRLRLHEGVPGREAHARREAVPDLRGHLADPAARDREGDLPG